MRKARYFTLAHRMSGARMTMVCRIWSITLCRMFSVTDGGSLMVAVQQISK